MTAQNQPQKVQAEKKRQRKTDVPSVEFDEELAGLERLPGGPMAAFGGGSIEDQAARLRDPRLQSAQRRALARQIGRTQGNLHLQRVVTSLREDDRRPAPVPPRGSTMARREGKPTVQTKSTQSKTTAVRSEVVQTQPHNAGQLIQRAFGTITLPIILAVGGAATTLVPAAVAGNLKLSYPNQEFDVMFKGTDAQFKSQFPDIDRNKRVKLKRKLFFSLFDSDGDCLHMYLRGSTNGKEMYEMKFICEYRTGDITNMSAKSVKITCKQSSRPSSSGAVILRISVEVLDLDPVGPIDDQDMSFVLAIDPTKWELSRESYDLRPDDKRIKDTFNHAIGQFYEREDALQP